MKKTIDNNYEIYAKKASGKTSIILNSSDSYTGTSINFGSDGIIEQTCNEGKKYIGAKKGIINSLDTDVILCEIPSSIYSIYDQDNIPVYSTVNVKCSFNVYKVIQYNTYEPGYGEPILISTDYLTKSYNVEKVACFTRADSTITQIGTTQNIYEISSFGGVVASIVPYNFFGVYTIQIKLRIPSAIYDYIGTVYQINYEYTIVQNTNYSIYNYTQDNTSTKSLYE